jgi:hypothetical protein
MASDITVRVCDPATGAREVVDRAVDVFARVERACTRFNPTSPLTLANADPKAWHEVPPKLFNAVREAAHAHLTTAGLFDPRVLRVLESLGYDRSLPFAGGPVTTPAAQPSEQPCGRLPNRCQRPHGLRTRRPPAWPRPGPAATSCPIVGERRRPR